MSAPPELTVKLWPVTITAKGTKAIDAIRVPLNVLVWARVILPVFFILAALIGGHEYLAWAFRLIRFW